MKMTKQDGIYLLHTSLGVISGTSWEDVKLRAAEAESRARWVSERAAEFRQFALEQQRAELEMRERQGR